MSVLKSAIAAAAALRVGLTVAGGTVEALLNDKAATTIGMSIVETNERGNAVLFFTDATASRVVCDSKGAVRVFGDAASAMGAVKRSKVGSAVTIEVFKFDPAVSVGSPVAALISAHKQSVKELATASAASSELGNFVTAAAAQGWNTQVGTPQRAEYDNLVSRKAIVDTWVSDTDGRKDALATSLTAANINPVTYLPIV